MPQRESAERRRARDRAIARRWQAGETQDELAHAYGLSPSRISRLIARLGVRRPPDMIVTPRWKPGRRAGRPPVWPDCPPHLRQEYLKIRPVIGSAAAKAQLLKLDARERGSVAQ